MSSILKVDTIQDQSGNNIINENADTITIGASGDTIDVPGTEVKTNKISPSSSTTLTLGDSGDTVNIVGTLQNNGSAVGGGTQAFDAGTVSLPSITTTGDTNTGIFFSTADTIDFAEGGVATGQFDSSGNFKFNSGFGSVGTAYACRAWVNFNGTGVVAIRASGNVTSITDNGTGDYTVNFTTAMPDTNFSPATSAIALGNDFVRNIGIFSKTTSSVRVQMLFAGANSAGLFDYTENNVQIFR